jgi:cytochrome P450
MSSEPTPSDFVHHYDIYSDVLANRWDEVVENLHAKGCPIVRGTEGEGYWVVNGYEDVKRIALDWETFSNASGFMPDRPADMPYFYPQESDPPLQKMLRKALNPFFTPAAVQVYEPAIRTHAQTLIEELKSRPEPDVVTGFATALPGRVFCDAVAGMSIEGVNYLQEAFEAGLLGPLDQRAAEMMRAREYLEGYLRQRESAPVRDDPVQAILNLPDVEWDVRVGTLMDLTIGGVGTTGFVFASALHYLAGHPDEREKLARDPALLPGAAQEFLRFFTATPHMARRVMKPAALDDVELSRGECVILNLGAANRDPSAFDRAEEVDLGRSVPIHHLAFGYGIHRCLGANLAQLDLRVGLEVFLSEIPNFSLPPGFVPSYEIGSTHTLESLPIVIGPSDQ